MKKYGLYTLLALLLMSGAKGAGVGTFYSL